MLWCIEELPCHPTASLFPSTWHLFLCSIYFISFSVPRFLHFLKLDYLERSAVKALTFCILLFCRRVNMNTKLKPTACPSKKTVTRGKYIFLKMKGRLCSCRFFEPKNPNPRNNAVPHFRELSVPYFLSTLYALYLICLICSKTVKVQNSS